MATVTITVQCPDRQGLVAAITGFIAEHRGNIINLDQYVDAEHDMFFFRAEWSLDDFTLDRERIVPALRQTLPRGAAPPAVRAAYSDVRPRLGILVSKAAHCLYDLLYRHKTGELACDIPLIAGNHDTLRHVADHFNIPFVHIPLTSAQEKAAAEERLLQECQQRRVDSLVLARYMQIVTRRVIDVYPGNMINIHHSFLPSFTGAKPYHQAYERGVKIIGATSHYVTENLDEGPIIHQDVTAVSHRESARDLVVKGREIEQRVLAYAVKTHLQRRVFVYGNRTYIL